MSLLIAEQEFCPYHSYPEDMRYFIFALLTEKVYNKSENGNPPKGYISICGSCKSKFRVIAEKRRDKNEDSVDADILILE